MVACPRQAVKLRVYKSATCLQKVPPIFSPSLITLFFSASCIRFPSLTTETLPSCVLQDCENPPSTNQSMHCILQRQTRLFLLQQVSRKLAVIATEKNRNKKDNNNKINSKFMVV
eukprot:m.199633 g.199633  ORF g.199633 m.199633 type:complete len:115 (-) comp13699_c0_seq4:2036-2380(-)